MSDFKIKYYPTAFDRANLPRLRNTLDDLEKAVRFTTADFLDNTAKRFVAPCEFMKGTSFGILLPNNTGNAFWPSGVATVGTHILTANTQVTVPETSVFTQLSISHYFESVAGGTPPQLTLTLYRADREENVVSLGSVLAVASEGTYVTNTTTSFTNETVLPEYTYFLQLKWVFFVQFSPKPLDIHKCCGVKLNYQLRP